MTRRSFLFAAAFAAGPEEVEVKGVIHRVELEPGRMPNLEIHNKEGKHHVMLGSMRYLMEKNFNPKAGSTAIVKGFRNGDVIVAREIEIPEQKLRIELRDKDGAPLWRGRHREGKK
jgi:hypothetical protein